MTKTKKYKSEAFAAIHETAAGMHDAGVIDRQTMRDFDESCITPGSGNVFVDLGLSDAEDLLKKANLALHIRSVIEARRLNEAQAAKVLGIDLPHLSSITNGRLDGFSTDQLSRLIDRLN